VDLTDTLKVATWFRIYQVRR